MPLVDCFASQPNYADHLRPVWEALPERGVWYAVRAEWAKGGRYVSTMPARLGITLVAGHADAMVVVKRGGVPILLEHGSGQTYVGAVNGYRHPSNAGGDLRERIGMFLCTNAAVAAANLARYDSIPCEVIGSPRLDVLRELRDQREVPDVPVLGLTWHWASRICPESNWAFAEWGEAMKGLEWPGEILGSAHHRSFKNAERWYSRVGIRPEPSWERMVERCDVVSADNTSCLFEAAALGIPVVVVNSIRYRRDVEHGLRFWQYADVGPNVWPGSDEVEMWSEACANADRYAEHMSLRVADMASTVYPHQGQAAELAVDAIARFVE